MAWLPKERSFSFEHQLIVGLFLLDGDVIAEEMGQDWTRGDKYPRIAFPSGLKFDLWEGRDSPIVHLFGEFDLALRASRDEAYEHASSIAEQVGYLVQPVGEDQLEVWGSDPSDRLLITYDNQQRLMTDVTVAKREEETPTSLPERIIRMAQEVILEHGSHVPTFIAQEGQTLVVGQVAELPDTHEGRVQVLFEAGFGLGQRGELADLDQVFFISEGWLSTPAEDGTIELPPSKDPQRKEVLFVSGLRVRDQQATFVVFEMLRDRGGQLIDLLELPMPQAEGGELQSPLLDALVAGFLVGSRGEASSQKESEIKPLFPLGRFVATPGAMEALKAAGQDPFGLLFRHVTGDWSEMDEHDQKENELSVREGFRILSAYTLATGEKVWVITEHDRSVTTILLPGDY